MAKPKKTYRCVVDCEGLVTIAKLPPGNVKSVALARLQDGTLRVPACVWEEFKLAYEDYAQELRPYLKSFAQLDPDRDYARAAALAEKLNSGFRSGPYDLNTRLYSASFAVGEDKTLLTANTTITFYSKISVPAEDVLDWILSNPQV